jgi:diguanylate cyclase (GGDEF)-like protein
MPRIKWPDRLSLRPRSLRARFGLALGLVAGITAANLAFLSWSGRQRERVFEDLRRAIDRHSALTETRAWLDDQRRQVDVLIDLLPKGGGEIGAAERQRILAVIAGSRDSLALAFKGTSDPASLEVMARIDSLAAAWQYFYLHLDDEPARAKARIDLDAARLADSLLSRYLPPAIRGQISRVQLANSAFTSGDRLWYRAAWFLLLATGGLFAVMALTTSRDLIRAVSALEAGAEQFGAGQLTHQVQVRNFDELAQVGDRLNTMAHRLQHAHTELALRNEELALLAFRDPLTKLANRALFRERVEQALQRPADTAASVGVVFIDLDNFKAVNDTFGHNTGDRLLVEVAARLLHTTRGCDTVARLGGDEFGVLIDGDEGNDALAIAERTVAGLRQPFGIDDRTIHVGASVGLSQGRDSRDADELLRNADVAMYAAKEDGGDCCRVFAPAMHEALLERAELESALRSGLDREEFMLEFQPIVELQSESIVGYEALLRWHNPERGDIQPTSFIPLAEECGVILPLGRWVLREACREAARWEQMLPTVPITVSVNVSSHQLVHAGFMADLTDALEESGLTPQRLVLEITERVIMRDTALNLERLRQMKGLGVRLAIDDFGTGFSSLAYLQRFPVDVIKIDKAFVKSVAISASDAALARTIIMLSETLNLKTVAEGIEYRDQQETLRDLGCQLGQGFLFARPLSASDIRALLRAHARAARPRRGQRGAGIHIGLAGPDPDPRQPPNIEAPRPR